MNIQTRNHTHQRQIPKAFWGWGGVQLVHHTLRLFVLHSWKTRSLDLHNTATFGKEGGKCHLPSRRTGCSWEQHHSSLASPSPVQPATALGQHWAEMPFYKSRESPKSVFLMSKKGLWTDGGKTIPPPGVPTFHIWQTQQTAALHLSSSTHQFLSPAHINSQSLDNICLCSSEARGVRRLAGNCSQLLSCSWVAQ